MENFRRTLLIINEIKNSGAISLPECNEDYTDTSIMCKKIYLPVDLYINYSVTSIGRAFVARPFYVNNNNVVMGSNIILISTQGLSYNGESMLTTIAMNYYGITLDFYLGTFIRNSTPYAIDPGNTQYVAGASMVSTSSLSVPVLDGCITLLGNCIGNMGLTSSNNVTQMEFTTTTSKVFPKERHYVCFDASDFSVYDSDSDDNKIQMDGFCIILLNAYSKWIDWSHNCPIEIYYEPFD